MRYKCAVIAVTFSLLLVLSCATLQQIVQPPDVKVEDINIADFSFEDITLDFKLLVNNPNPFGISLQGYDYSFSLEGKEFLSAEEKQSINVDAAGRSSIKIPVTVNFEHIMELVKQTRDLDSLSFDLMGKLHPDGVLSAFTIPFERHGKLPNVRMPKIGFSGLKIIKMGFSGVKLELGLNIVNKNAFGFDIGALNYDIALAGMNVAKGMTDQLASIPAKGKGDIKLPITINFASAIGSLSSALRAKTIPTEIVGNAALNTPFGPITLPFAAKQEIAILR